MLRELQLNNVRELIPQSALETLQRTLGNMSGIIEVATSCNLACEYCFAQRDKKSIMPLNVVKKIIEELSIYNGTGNETKFIWHGGEPLLGGLSFYKEVLKVQKQLEKHGYKYRNSLQTNGTLLTDEWTDFFIENNFGVGSSLDGLPEIHDLKRRDLKGDPTYDRVVKNLLRAKERGLHIGVICVISRETLPYVEQIYNKMKELGIHFTMSPVTPNHGEQTDLQPLTPEEYRDVLIRLFDVWFNDSNPTITVNPPHSIIQGLIYGGIPLYCSTDDSCFSKFISFLPDGTVYPCNRFAGENDFLLGNIMENSLNYILLQEPRKKLLNRTKDNLTPCSTCESNNVCRGGCAHHAYAFFGDIMNPDYYCKAFFKAFSYYKEKLDNALCEASINNQSIMKEGVKNVESTKCF
jgi:uncharacterized protein